jgi:hypothetical protein
VIPIVFAAVGDRVESGVVKSLARPGGNATGLSLQATDAVGKRLQLLGEVITGLRRLAIMANSGNPSAARHSARQNSCAARRARASRARPPKTAERFRALLSSSPFEAPLWGARDRRAHARRVTTLRAKGPTARQMISIAAAITIPVTNAVKQEKSSRSLRTTLMAASPCGPWSFPRA